MIRTRTISFTSGKGGVGKTTIACNVSSRLAKMGFRTLLLDGDFGLANADVHFNLHPQFTMNDVIKMNKTLAEIITPVEENLWLIPGGSGIREIQNLDWALRRHLLDQVSSIEGDFDYLVVDTGPGLSDNVLGLNMAVDTTVVIITPDPSSFVDAYALIKVLNQEYDCKRLSVMANMVRDADEGLSLYRRFSETTSKFLEISLDYIGSLPMDLKLRRANIEQSLVTKSHPFSPSSVAFLEVCRSIVQVPPNLEFRGGVQFFWKSVVGAA